MKFITCCWLLAALVATGASAQTHPRKKPHRPPLIEHKPLPVGRARLAEDQGIYCSLPFETSIEKPEIAPVPEDPNRVYTYVEQMPRLNGHSDFAYISAAIYQCLALPPAAPAGRTFVQFVITKEGLVSQPRIVKGLRADVDSAIVAATRMLPRFTPGRHSGQAVLVSYTIAILTSTPIATPPAEMRRKE